MTVVVVRYSGAYESSPVSSATYHFVNTLNRHRRCTKAMFCHCRPVSVSGLVTDKLKVKMCDQSSPLPKGLCRLPLCPGPCHRSKCLTHSHVDESAVRMHAVVTSLSTHFIKKKYGSLYSYTKTG